MTYQIYTHPTLEIVKLSKTLIKNVECKHIELNTPLPIAKIFEQKSTSVNYPFCYMSLKDNYNIIENQNYVRNMANIPNFRPAKYIIDKNGRIWADNTHTSLSIMIRNGFFAPINSADYYFVDLRKGITIFQPSHLPILNEAIYNKIVINSLKLQKRLNEGWRPLSLSYTLENLYLTDKYNLC